MSLEVERNAKPASKKRGYWGCLPDISPGHASYWYLGHVGHARLGTCLYCRRCRGATCVPENNRCNLTLHRNGYDDVLARQKK